MKKTFSVEVEGKKPARVVDSIKHELNKYLKRERRKKLPDGADFRDFDCRIGATSETAVVAHVSKLSQAIDAVIENGSLTVYVEILSKPGFINKNPKTKAE